MVSITVIKGSVFPPNQTALTGEVNAVDHCYRAVANFGGQIRGEHIVNVGAARAATTRVIATVIWNG
jgi:hypothetical protein